MLRCFKGKEHEIQFADSSCRSAEKFDLLKQVAEKSEKELEQKLQEQSQRFSAKITKAEHACSKTLAKVEQEAKQRLEEQEEQKERAEEEIAHLNEELELALYKTQESSASLTKKWEKEKANSARLQEELDAVLAKRASDDLLQQRAARDKKAELESRLSGMKRQVEESLAALSSPDLGLT